MIKVYKDQRAASEAMAEDFKAIAQKSVQEQGRFNVSLTGGSSPLILHELLRSGIYKEAIPWKQSFIFWGDERAVPFNDIQNNAKMGFETLLNHVPVPKEQIYRINSELRPEAAAEEYEKLLRAHFRHEPASFDLVLLGMGSDGHTASVFPGSEVIKEEHKWVSKGYNAQQDSERITLTAPLINRAKNIFFAVFGAEKARMLKNVLEGEFKPEVYPAQLIKPVNGTITWYVDEEAAKDLQKS